MTTDKIDVLLETKQKGLKEAVDRLKELRTVAQNNRQVLDQYNAIFNEITKSIGKSNRELAQFYRNLARYSKGALQDQVKNSEITRAINTIKAQSTNLQSELINQRTKLIKSSLNSLDNAQFLKDFGLSNRKGPLDAKELMEVKARIEAVNKAKKEQIAIDTKLNALADQYKRKTIELRSRSDVSSSLKEEAMLKGKVDLTRTRNLLELNAIQIKKAQAVEDQKLLGILQQRQTSLRKIVEIQSQSLAQSRKLNVEGNKKSHEEIRANREGLLFGDGGASLFKIQAALLVNYTLMNQLFNLYQFGTQFVLELDKSFQNLQAIIGATNGQMVGLKDTIVGVSTSTKFTAVEVAQAAEVLGQAGFTVEQIQGSLKGVVLLATATGSTLEKSVDVASSAISVFNLRAEDMVHVANVMTSAINDTKLDMDKLALSLQYAGNIANEAGLTFEETTAIIGAMANAGIRSGSTLGTGLRQLLTEFISPSEKFQNSLKRIGLTVDDIDVKSKGFVNVLKNMREAGFTASDAFESLDLRAAAAFAAIQNNPDVLLRLQEGFIYSTAAAKANEIQMKSLANTIDNLKSAVGVFINEGSGPLVTTLQLLASGLTSLLAGTSAIGPLLQIATTAMVGFGLAVVGVKLASLVSNLFLAQKGLQAVGISAIFAGNAMKAGVLTSFLGLLSPVGQIGLALTTIIGLFQLFGGGLSDMKQKLDDAKTAFADAKGEVEATTNTITSVDENLARLLQRFTELKNAPEAVRIEFLQLQDRFGSLGFKIENETKPSIENLIDSLRELRDELNKTKTAQLEDMLSRQAVLFQEQASFNKQRLNDIAPKGYEASDNPLGGLSGGGIRKSYGDSFTSKAQETFAKTVKLQMEMETMDLNNASKATINEIKGRIASLNTELFANSNELNKQVSSLKKSALAGDRSAQQQVEAYKEWSDRINTARETANSLMDNLLKFDGSRTDAVDSLFTTTDLAKDYTKAIEDFNVKVGELKAQWAAASKSPEEQKKIQLEIEALIKNLDAELLGIVQSKAGTVAATFAAAGKAANEQDLIRLRDSVLNPAATGAKAEATKGLSDRIDSTISASDAAIEGAKNLLDQQKEIFERLDRVYQNKTQELDTIMREVNDLERGGLRGRFNDVELSMMQDRQKGYAVDGLRAKIAGGPALIGAYDNLIGAQGGLVDKNAAIARLEKTPEKQIALAKSQKDLLDLERQRADAIDDLNQKQIEYNAMIGVTTEQNVSLGEQIQYVLRGYSETMKIQSQWGYNLKSNIIEGLDQARDSFSSFVFDMMTGADSVSGSFKKMATSILESMLRIQTDKMAAGLLSMVTDFAAGAIGSWFGGPTGTNGTFLPASGPSPSITWNGMKTGGMVRAATGMGVQGRDSVPILARPGEYLLRNQAVEMIGKDNLDQINAMGARSFSQSAPAPVNTNNGGGGAVNVWVVSPDQQPNSMGPKDIVAVISQDIRNGGTIKKMIKSVQTGG